MCVVSLFIFLILFLFMILCDIDELPVKTSKIKEPMNLREYFSKMFNLKISEEYRIRMVDFQLNVNLFITYL